MNSFQSWRQFNELSTGEEIASQPPQGSSRAAPLQAEKDQKEKQINADLTYLKYVFGKARGRADRQLVTDIKTKVAQAKDRFAQQVGGQSWEELSLLDQYEFMIEMMQAVMVASMPGDYKNDMNWSQSKMNRIQKSAERFTPPNQAPSPMQPPADMPA